MSTESNKIVVVRGDSHTIRLNLTDYETGAPINLTGLTVFFTVKQDLNDGDTLAQIAKTIDSFDDPTSGQLDIPLTSNDTDTAGEYWYDIQVKQGDGGIQSSHKGKFIIEQDVTLRVTVS